MAAAHVRHGRAALQFLDNSVERREPFIHQMGRIAGAEEPLGAAKEAGAVFMPADAAAGSERLGDLRLVLEHGREHIEAAGQEGGARLIGQDQGLLRRHEVRAGLRLVLDVPGRGLRGQPFADITLGGVGAYCQFGRGQRLTGGEGLVEPQLVADEYHRSGRGSAHIGEKLADKGIELPRSGDMDGPPFHGSGGATNPRACVRDAHARG